MAGVTDDEISLYNEQGGEGINTIPKDLCDKVKIDVNETPCWLVCEEVPVISKTLVYAICAGVVFVADTFVGVTEDDIFILTVIEYIRKYSIEMMESLNEFVKEIERIIDISKSCTF